MIWWWSRVFINKLSEGLLWHLIVTQRSQLAILSSSHNLFSKKLQSYHRIIEYPELEVMYKALQVQLLAAQRTTQNSKPVFESVVQTLPWTTALGAVPTALPLTPNCPSPDSSMPFPQALLLSQRAELSAASPLPVRSCSHHEAFPQLLCSALSTLRVLSLSSYVLHSRPFTTIFVTLLWMFSLIVLCPRIVMPKTAYIEMWLFNFILFCLLYVWDALCLRCIGWNDRGLSSGSEQKY